ncbi:MAG: MmgE/PrpD [uncultured Thermomicrobiales bacterium]|uniref:MmgE/PrpD n=1 Tax=uncultured Thermomicrobiales bacterium TaxID=1645740 RepID=A0A6J4U416_9BACT|nr:MAG: MmgE/PrpD [uncultured Thermomicrobiales bacterium]
MDVVRFIHDTRWNDLPAPVQHQARRCLLDTLGAAIGGRQTELSRIVHEFAAATHGGGGARLWLDGRAVSAPGAALANGMTIDALDVHDGAVAVKGHAGAAVVPAALAAGALDADRPVAGQELLTALVVGYEVALRAGVALHATARDYHTSGAWNALGCAAVVARRLGLGEHPTRHALGIAEYHGPRSPMMRCIDHPTMLKDGSGWGAMTGVAAALLAEAGFTGAPALTVDAPEVAATWADLGDRWRITEQFFKPWAVCRWAQPAIAGALALQRDHAIPPAAIERIAVTTFHQATRLAARRPVTTEEAQYSLPFPVAAALVHGRLGLAQLDGAGLADPRVLRLADRVELIDDPAHSARFPAERLARVRIETATGAVHDSGDVPAPWDAATPPSDAELTEKFRHLATESVSPARATALLDAVWGLAGAPDAGELVALLAGPGGSP